MNALSTFRFSFDQDEDFPQFKRLAWELVDAPVRDVLLHGIHPWTADRQGGEAHPSLVEAFALRLNEPGAKIADLEQFGYSGDIAATRHYYQQRPTRFEQTLESIRQHIRFVDKLTYLELLAIAKERLRAAWDHRLARSLTERAYPGFQELRRFLKTKDKQVKLSGYGDIEQYDLGHILSLEDFEGRDSLLISEAIPSLNFRKTSWLSTVTDERGRLRLVPQIPKITLTMVPEGPDYVHLVWHVEREGETCRFCPEIGQSAEKRRKAREFAEQWREDDGRLCFTTSLDQVSEMVEGRMIAPSFPTLNYTFEHRGPTAAAQVPDERVPAYVIGAFYDRKSNSDALKDILREYGVSMTGNKARLAEKLARLAAARYAERREEIDAYFSEHQFVRIAVVPPKAERMPLLEDEPLMRNLVLTMYAMKHLRGNAVLDVAHENNTYTAEQLALALVMGKVGFTGAFLRAA